MIKLKNRFLVAEDILFAYRMSIIGSDVDGKLYVEGSAQINTSSFAVALKDVEKHFDVQIPQKVIVLTSQSSLQLHNIVGLDKLSNSELRKVLERESLYNIRNGESFLSLGVLLLRMKRISEDELEELLLLQKEMGQKIYSTPIRIGKLACKQGYCTNDDVQRALSAQKRADITTENLLINWEDIDNGVLVNVTDRDALKNYCSVAKENGFQMQAVYPLYGSSLGLASLHQGKTQVIAEWREGATVVYHLVYNKLCEYRLVKDIYPASNLADLSAGTGADKLYCSIDEGFSKEKWEEEFKQRNVPYEFLVPNAINNVDVVDSSLAPAIGAINLENNIQASYRSLLRTAPPVKQVRRRILLITTVILLLAVYAFVILSISSKECALEKYRGIQRNHKILNEKIKRVEEELAKLRKSKTEISTYHKERRTFSNSLLRIIMDAAKKRATIDKCYESLNGDFHIEGVGWSIKKIEQLRQDLSKNLTGYHPGIPVKKISLQETNTRVLQYSFHLLFEKRDANGR